jgi:hypothetical protein
VLITRGKGSDCLKVHIIKFNINPSSGSHSDICEQGEWQTDMTKLIGTSNDYGKAANNVLIPDKLNSLSNRVIIL